MRKFLYIITCFFAIILLGCDNSSSTTAPSSVAKLNAFSFAKVDTMPGLAQAVFTVEERLDTGLVWNKDSMLYGTDLHRVVPRFVFAATPSASSLIFPDTVCLLTGYDTLDFTKTPIYLSIRSADKTNTKVYEIRPTVHQVDPDLYTWEKIFDGFGVAEDAEQRVVEQNGDFVMIVSNGFELKVYRSPDGSNWGPEEAPTGLPAGTKVRQIISDGETLYYAQEQTIYTSTDGITWIATPVSEEVVTMLLYWNEEVWVLTQKEGWKYELATFDDEGLHLSGLKPMEEFPHPMALRVLGTSDARRRVPHGGVLHRPTAVHQHDRYLGRVVQQPDAALRRRGRQDELFRSRHTHLYGRRVNLDQSRQYQKPTTRSLSGTTETKRHRARQQYIPLRRTRQEYHL